MPHELADVSELYVSYKPFHVSLHTRAMSHELSHELSRELSDTSSAAPHQCQPQGSFELSCGAFFSLAYRALFYHEPLRVVKLQGFISKGLHRI